METITYTLPEYLAPYLINGDCSHMTEEEINEINTWMQEVNPGSCVQCSEEGFFTWHNDLNSLGATCLEYTFIK